MGLLCSLGHRATTQCAHALRWHWDLVGFVLVNLWCSGHWYVDHCLSLFFWQFYCLSFNLRLLITTLVSSDYHFGIFWLPLWFLLITPMVSSDYHFGFFWLPLWFLLITTLVSSDYHSGFFWLPLWFLLITTLVSSDYHSGFFKLFLWSIFWWI